MRTRQVGDEGLEPFNSAPVFHSLKRNSPNQLGAQVGAELSLSQVVALLIERCDELAQAVKEEIAELLGDG